LAKCILRAPQPGQVVYANNSDRYSTADAVIEEGTMVRERQVILRLPDPKRMEVKAKINEAKIALVQVGDEVTIHLDAFPEAELSGIVQKVNEYPAPAAWYASNVKEYETTVRIPESPVPLKPGLTAEVRIRVAQEPAVLQLPVQSVFEHGSKHYVVVREGNQWRGRPVEVGPTNDKTIVIRGGLDAGQQVVLNASAYREKVGLPEVPASAESGGMMAGSRRSSGPQAGAERAGGKAGPGAATVPANALASTAGSPPSSDPASAGAPAASPAIVEPLVEARKGRPPAGAARLTRLPRPVVGNVGQAVPPSSAASSPPGGGRR
jgi:hypothetical protein